MSNYPRAASETRHPADARQGWILLTLCLAVLCVQVDTSVVNLAVRPIADYFHARVAAMQWLIDGYNLTYAALLLSGGLLADLFGRRRVFVAGAALFAAASLLCALAPDLPILLAGRVLAGVAAALLLPASLAMIRVVWDDEKARGKALGIWAGCNGLALAIGPPLGGVLIHLGGWRWLFFLTVPLGLAAFLLAPRLMPESADRQGRHLDLPGQLLGIVMLGGATLAAIEGRDAPWPAGVALGLCLLAGLGFAVVERRRGDAALVPPVLFRVAPFRGAVLATLAMTFGMYGALFLLPMTWIAADRLGPLGAGVALMPMALIFVAMSPSSGALVARFGLRVAVSLGLGLIIAGLVLIGLGGGAASLWSAEAGLALTGLGMGCATGPLMGAAVNAVNPARAGTAAALINVARMVGATLGVALLGSLYAQAGGGERGLVVAMLAAAVLQALAVTVAARWLPAR